MKIFSVIEVLQGQGFDPPALAVLDPGADTYRALLIQPEGNIEGDKDGVRHHDRKVAEAQFQKLFSIVESEKPELFVTPEYSTPWAVLLEKLKAGVKPRKADIWALGCESIKFSELSKLKNDSAGIIELIFENLEPNEEKFVDPLIYIFNSLNKKSNRLETVGIVQFKTHPMGDRDHFERTYLQVGSGIYLFGDPAKENHLASLICSDTFNFDDAAAKAIHDRALILHIQLNDSPRHAQYRKSRVELLDLTGNETEIICLNWARNVCDYSSNPAKNWKNISGSAWYLRPEQFDYRDATIGENHKKGLYYTWLRPSHVHAMFFNYAPGIFVVEATKVSHRNIVASVARRRGPQLRRAYCWDKSKSDWTSSPSADDGFKDIIADAGPARTCLESLCPTNPIAIERILALTAGKVSLSTTWHDVKNLDSCVIDDSEIIMRITFSQDTNENAVNFRTARLRRTAELWNIVQTGQLPPAIADLGSAGFNLAWSEANPNCNAISGAGGSATLIYMGEDSSLEQCQAVYKKAAELLRRSASSEDESIRARERLVVWYRSFGELKRVSNDNIVGIDKTTNRSELDFGRSE